MEQQLGLHDEPGLNSVGRLSWHSSSNSSCSLEGGSVSAQEALGSAARSGSSSSTSSWSGLDLGPDNVRGLGVHGAAATSAPPSSPRALRTGRPPVPAPVGSPATVSTRAGHSERRMVDHSSGLAGGCSDAGAHARAGAGGVSASEAAWGSGEGAHRGQALAAQDDSEVAVLLLEGDAVLVEGWGGQDLDTLLKEELLSYADSGRPSDSAASDANDDEGRALEDSVGAASSGATEEAPMAGVSPAMSFSLPQPSHAVPTPGLLERLATGMQPLLDHSYSISAAVELPSEPVHAAAPEVGCAAAAAAAAAAADTSTAADTSGAAAAPMSAGGQPLDLEAFTGTGTAAGTTAGSSQASVRSRLLSLAAASAASAAPLPTAHASIQDRSRAGSPSGTAPAEAQQTHQHLERHARQGSHLPTLPHPHAIATAGRLEPLATPGTPAQLELVASGGTPGIATGRPASEPGAEPYSALMEICVMQGEVGGLGPIISKLAEVQHGTGGSGSSTSAGGRGGSGGGGGGGSSRIPRASAPRPRPASASQVSLTIAPSASEAGAAATVQKTGGSEAQSTAANASASAPAPAVAVVTPALRSSGIPKVAGPVAPQGDPHLPLQSGQAGDAAPGAATSSISAPPPAGSVEGPQLQTVPQLPTGASCDSVRGLAPWAPAAAGVHASGIPRFTTTAGLASAPASTLRPAPAARQDAAPAPAPAPTRLAPPATSVALQTPPATAAAPPAPPAPPAAGRDELQAPAPASAPATVPRLLGLGTDLHTSGVFTFRPLAAPGTSKESSSGSVHVAGTSSGTGRKPRHPCQPTPPASPVKHPCQPTPSASPVASSAQAAVPSTKESLAPAAHIPSHMHLTRSMAGEQYSASSAQANQRAQAVQPTRVSQIPRPTASTHSYITDPASRLQRARLAALAAQPPAVSSSTPSVPVAVHSGADNLLAKIIEARSLARQVLATARGEIVSVASPPEGADGQLAAAAAANQEADEEAGDVGAGDAMCAGASAALAAGDAMCTWASAPFAAGTPLVVEGGGGGKGQEGESLPPAVGFGAMQQEEGEGTKGDPKEGEAHDDVLLSTWGSGRLTQVTGQGLGESLASSAGGGGQGLGLTPQSSTASNSAVGSGFEVEESEQQEGGSPSEAGVLGVAASMPSRYGEAHAGSSTQYSRHVVGADAQQSVAAAATAARSVGGSSPSGPRGAESQWSVATQASDTTAVESIGSNGEGGSVDEGQQVGSQQLEEEEMGAQEVGLEEDGQDELEIDRGLGEKSDEQGAGREAEEGGVIWGPPTAPPRSDAQADGSSGVMGGVGKEGGQEGAAQALLVAAVGEAALPDEDMVTDEGRLILEVTPPGHTASEAANDAAAAQLLQAAGSAGAGVVGARAGQGAAAQSTNVALVHAPPGAVAPTTELLQLQPVGSSTLRPLLLGPLPEAGSESAASWIPPVLPPLTSHLAPPPVPAIETQPSSTPLVTTQPAAGSQPPRRSRIPSYMAQPCTGAAAKASAASGPQKQAPGTPATPATPAYPGAPSRSAGIGGRPVSVSAALRRAAQEAAASRHAQEQPGASQSTGADALDACLPLFAAEVAEMAADPAALLAASPEPDSPLAPKAEAQSRGGSSRAAVIDDASGEEQQSTSTIQAHPPEAVLLPSIADTTNSHESSQAPETAAAVTDDTDHQAHPAPVASRSPAPTLAPSTPMLQQFAPGWITEITPGSVPSSQRPSFGQGPSWPLDVDQQLTGQTLVNMAHAAAEASQELAAGTLGEDPLVVAATVQAQAVLGAAGVDSSDVEPGLGVYEISAALSAGSSKGSGLESDDGLQFADDGDGELSGELNADAEELTSLAYQSDSDEDWEAGWKAQEEDKGEEVEQNQAHEEEEEEGEGEVVGGNEGNGEEQVVEEVEEEEGRMEEGWERQGKEEEGEEEISQPAAVSSSKAGVLVKDASSVVLGASSWSAAGLRGAAAIGAASRKAVPAVRWMGTAVIMVLVLLTSTWWLLSQRKQPWGDGGSHNVQSLHGLHRLNALLHLVDRHTARGLIQNPQGRSPAPAPVQFQHITLPQNISIISGPLDARALLSTAYQSSAAGHTQICTHEHMTAVTLDIHAALSAAGMLLADDAALSAGMVDPTTQEQELSDALAAAAKCSRLLQPAVTRLVNVRHAAHHAALASLAHAAAGLQGHWAQAFLQASDASAVHAHELRQYQLRIETECTALKASLDQAEGTRTAFHSAVHALQHAAEHAALVAQMQAFQDAGPETATASATVQSTTADDTADAATAALLHTVRHIISYVLGPLEQEAATWRQLAQHCTAHALQLRALQSWLQLSHTQARVSADPELDLDMILDLITTPDLQHLLGVTGSDTSKADEAAVHFDADYPRVHHMQQQLSWRVQQLLVDGQPVVSV